MLQSCTPLCWHPCSFNCAASPSACSQDACISMAVVSAGRMPSRFSACCVSYRHHRHHQSGWAHSVAEVGAQQQSSTTLHAQVARGSPTIVCGRGLIVAAAAGFALSESVLPGVNGSRLGVDLRR
eukprot:jgi/Ulvmu1/10722/UM068_0007.1